MTLFSPPAYRGVYRLTRVPNLAELTGHTLVLISANQARTLLLYLQGTDPRAQRAVHGRRVVLVLTVAGMTVAFRLAPIDRDAPGSFTRQYASAPWVAEYWALFLLNLCATLLQMARQCWQLASLTDRAFLRQGLRLISTGGVLGVAYFLHWGGYLLVRRRGGELPTAVRIGARATAIAAVSSIVTGSLLPALGPTLAEQRGADRVRLHASLRRLYPLWHSVCAAVPEVALDGPPDRWSDLRDLRDLDHRHYRRVIEIRDGWLALRPFMSSGVRARAKEIGARRGLQGVPLDAAVAATSLAVAIRAKQGGVVPGDPLGAEPPSTTQDLADESAWLEQVSVAYRSRLVQRLANEFLPEAIGKVHS